MKRIASMFAALMAVASLATVRGAFAADIGKTLENYTGTVTAETLSEAGGDLLLIYNSTTTAAELTLEGQTKAWVLVVGGGGAGGAGGSSTTNPGGGGGGGGGGVVENESVLFTPGKYTITVGDGGVRVLNKEGENGNPSFIQLDGADVLGLRALGGGGGGIGGLTGTVGLDGANGGGGGALNNGGSGSQGNGGGNSSHSKAGGGGGGAGAAGGNTTAANTGANGGDGKASAITGTSVTYGGGGGGGAINTGTAGNGGAGGGGKGDDVTTAVAGDDGLGGGGGGGGSLRLRRGANGGSGVVIIRISAVFDAVEKPNTTAGYYDVTYDGAEHVVLEPNDAYTLTTEYKATDVKAGGGSYVFTATLQDGLAWADGTTDPVTISWKILQATSYINDLTQRGWKAGNPVKPTCEHNPGAVVSYTYSDAKDGTYTATQPTEPGTYWLKAEIVGTRNYTAAGPEYVEFNVLEGGQSPMESLGYFAEISFADYTGESQTWVPVKVDLSETTVGGFEWRTILNDLSDVRFCDAGGMVYPSAIRTAGYGGTSTFCVIVPALDSSTSLFLCWGPVEGEELPAIPTALDFSEGQCTLLPASCQMTTVAGMAMDGAGRDPRYTLANHWVTEPVIATTWSREDGGPAYRTDGVAAYAAEGEPIFVMTSLGTGEAWTNEYPTVAGTYSGEFIVAANENEKYGALTREYPLMTISDHSPYYDLTGDAEDLSSSGRILLMNRDVGEGEKRPAVENQGYADTNETYTTYWKHIKVQKPTSSVFALCDSIQSELWSRNGFKLWTIDDCRHGSNYRANNKTLLPAVIYMPYAGTSRSIHEHNSEDAIEQAGVGQVVMRNTTNACVVSSCLTEGIGTIYFDAVNGSPTHIASGDECFEIIVQIATNCLASVNDELVVVDKPPTDENVRQVITAADGTVTTNDFGFANWQTVTLHPLIKDQTATFQEMSATNALTLAIENGGTAENFYRVYVPLNYHCPTRFRIKRTMIHPSFVRDTQLDDYRTLIVLDNIIASYPAMKLDLTSAGTLDRAKTGKETLGYEGSFTEPLPAVGATGVHAVATDVPYTNSALSSIDTAMFVVGAHMNYRWRYLEQKTNEWMTVNLNPKDGYRSIETLSITNTIGDIEYYFDIDLNAPFYSYADYTGLERGLDGFYTEEITAVTNRCAEANLPSRGTDWFVRLRQGVSEWSTAEVLVKWPGDETATAVPMELVSDNTWRGCLQTPTNQTGTIRYRFAFHDRREAGVEFEPNTTYYVGSLDSATTPASGRIASVPETAAEGEEEEWSEFDVDAATGYLMFQIDDSTAALTVVHADYQTFDGWSDAKGSKYVGNSTEDESKVGTSPQKKTFAQDFDSWKSMPETESDWQLFSFPDIMTLYGREAYRAYPSDTDRGWTIGPGMWVSKYFADQSNNAKDKGVAFQMEGSGAGYIQYTSESGAPRGLKSVSFNARLGQFINVGDFCYYDGEIKQRMTNYTFLVKSAFDTRSNAGFAGNASLSVIAAYRPGKGFYEARWEQFGASWQSGRATGYAPRGQRLWLYRWMPRSNGKMEATPLGCVTNTVNDITKVNLLNTSASFTPIFISVSNTVSGATVVTAGVSPAGMTVLNNPSGTTNWIGIQHEDATSGHPTAGTYGVLSSNCEGVFANMVAYDSAMSFGNSGRFDKNTQISAFTGKTPTTKCYEQLDEDLWAITPGRMEYVTHATSNPLKSLRAVVVPEYVSVYTAPAGTQNWTSRATFRVGSFGSVSTAANYTTNLYLTADCAVKIAVDSEWNDPRTDIVIDSIELKQWRGDDYSKSYMTQYVPGWLDPYTSERGMTNWVFTSAWVTNAVTGTGANAKTNGCVLLSAKRTPSGTAASIRTPIMDGYTFSDGTKRGTGLGMISYDWEEADGNARLLVQIATNRVASTRLSEFDTIDDSRWTTIATNDFSKGYTDAQRKQGDTVSVYVGLHGVTGLMRIVVDPDLVDEVADETNPAKFGSIKIKKVVCKDEPLIDSGCWWGWNMRTIGADGGRDTEGRMFLPDLTSDSEKVGMSAALNNSVTADIADADDKETYKQNVPFVQTPTFASNIVGEVSFKARRHDSNTGQPASVTLYGSTKGGTDGSWESITNFVVTCDTYETFSYKTEGQNYSAFRLGVSGVPGVEGGGGEVVPDGYSYPVRVLLDEVLVCEAVRARMGFRNVGAFRTDMAGTGYVPNVPSKGEQPLCLEGWGVECEVYAAQLANEIDLTRSPSVFLHWFEGEEPWGFENWKGLTKAQGHNQAALAPASGTNMIYRSSYTSAPGAVVDMSTRPGTVVQYMLEVRYFQTGKSVATTNFMSMGEWKRPDWYRPLDLNATRGGGTEAGFAAYNILDSVAPGWAWINEVNIHGMYDRNWDNSESDCQFVEIAVPVESDISGWSVRLLSGDAQSGDGVIVTNTIGRFGTSELPGTKPGNMGEASNMVFRVIGSPKSAFAGNLKAEDGTLDYMWEFENNSDAFRTDNELASYEMVGVQLVRASGVVEHEIMCIGTNYYANVPGLEKYYDPATVLEYYRSCLGESGMFYVGADDHDRDAAGNFRSLGVFESNGETADVWNNVMKRTPGRINAEQFINPDDIPHPNGESILVVFSLDQSVGHIRQTVGDGVETNTTQTVFIRRGSQLGTNVVYTVDPWYQLASVRTNGQAAAWTDAGTRRYVVTVGAGASNNVTVVASAKIEDRLEQDYGLTSENPYTPAVVRWLSEGTDLYGNEWPNAGSDEIHLAEFIRPNDEVITNLNLTQMYWLDMDPTVPPPGLALKGYVSKGPSLHKMAGTGGADLTNICFDVFMQITNRSSGAAWSPYALRGLSAGSSSIGYAGRTTADGWTSATFKMVGFINNGLTGWNVRDNWVPLRWFVFTPESFRPADSENPYTTTIEIKDPFSTDTPAYTAGWYDWAKEHGKPQDFYFWCLDERIQPINVEVLKQDNTYGD